MPQLGGKPPSGFWSPNVFEGPGNMNDEAFSQDDPFAEAVAPAAPGLFATFLRALVTYGSVILKRSMCRRNVDISALVVNAKITGRKQDINFKSFAVGRAES